MTRDAFNTDMSRATALKPDKSAKRTLAPEWNGQALVARGKADSTKSSTFKVRFSDGAVVITKSARSK